MPRMPLKGIIPTIYIYIMCLSMCVHTKGNSNNLYITLFTSFISVDLAPSPFVKVIQIRQL